MSNHEGEDPDRMGVIDLGSNSVLLLVMDRRGMALREESRITRLGEGLFRGPGAGRLASAARQRTLGAVEEFAGIARGLRVRRLIGVGTEALRVAADGRDFLEELRAAGLVDEARLLTGEEEAAFTIEASRRSARESGSLAVIDVGGGSTEIAWASPGAHVQGVSLPLGSVRLTEAIVSGHPISELELGRLADAVARTAMDRIPAQLDGFGDRGEVVAVAGTATTLAALAQRLEVYSDERVEGMLVEHAEVEGWIERLAALDVEGRQALPGMEPGRADVIVAGLVILSGVLGRIGAVRFRVSGRGVRHGVALSVLAALPAV
jgi:exopolyphosphatase/guanosine-5'-triphosphate,3'-diphosphate pyrophosphatase